MSARPLPSFPPVVTLVPQSCLQFVDFAFAIDGRIRVNRAFLEEEVDGGEQTLQALVFRDGDHVHPLTDEVCEPTYSLNAQRGLEPFLDTWVPVPFMRILGRDKHGRDVYDQGPSNWARVYVTADGGEGEAPSYRLVLAFDTEIDGRGRASDRPYLMPTAEDAEGEVSFGFSSDSDDIGWFVGSSWVDQWLEEVFHDSLRRKDPRRRFRPETLPYAFEHTARYLTFLGLLEQACPLPRIRLIDNVSKERSYTPIKVDLVIDVGNSRTCGILIESDPDNADRLDLSKSFVLSLRDLSRPTEVHALPFESRVEFSRPSFGKDGISRWSGRRGTAFYWPSLVRIGPEAERLSVSPSGSDAATGMSSPKRYLWDRRPLNQVWRFRTSDDSGGADPQVSGPLLAFVTETGDVLRQLKREAPAAIRPKFSRSSLFTFLMNEVVLQAVTSINSAESRWRQGNANIPRELHRIIMTIPPATPLAEQRIMKDRVEGAVKLAWQALGWAGASDVEAPPEPIVQIAFDEATCTQIVYLYSEITQKLRSPASDFFRIMGRANGTAEPSLRIASLDIGGGTTDLIVIAYTVEQRRAIVPTQLFREGFKIAGDDILEAVVGRHVLPSIEAALTAAGMQEARGFLRGVVGADRGGQSEQERQFRRRFVTQICVPSALAVLRDYETTKPFTDEAPSTMTLAGLLGDTNPSAASEFDREVQAAGLTGFDLLRTPVKFSAGELNQTVQSVMSGSLADLAEIIHSLDCDIVLLSGRPSRFPVVLDLLQSRLPTRPDRIIPMHQYKVGRWYPFRDRSDRIDDPKTTVAVGALLCNLAEAQIDGFVLSKSKLGMKSTARFIGVMELSNAIRNDQILFANVDLDGKKRDDETATDLTAFLPVTIGFRQLPIERWPATPLYMVEYTNPANTSRLKLPLKIKIERAFADGDDEAKNEDFKVTEVEDAEGTALRTSDVVMRLQTLKSTTGYWLDTGVVETY